MIWGHEHECLIEPTERRNSGEDSVVFIMQPGSSVVTSLCVGEMKEKLVEIMCDHVIYEMSYNIRHVAILSVKGTDFKVEKIPLKTVRPYIFTSIDLADSDIQPELEDDVMSYVSDQVSCVIIGCHGMIIGCHGDSAIHITGEGAHH